MESFDLIKSFPSASKLSSYLKVSLNFGAELAKLIKASEYSAVIYKYYIISLTPLSIDYLQSNKKLFPIKKAPIKKGTGSSIIIMVLILLLMNSNLDLPRQVAQKILQGNGIQM